MLKQQRLFSGYMAAAAAAAAVGTLLFLAAAITPTNAQTPASPCLRTFREIYNFEDKLDDEDTATFRTYTICPNTLLEPGVADINGIISSDDLPLSCKENCLVRCGASGSSSNNCKIDGTGSFGVFQIPLYIFTNQPDSGENVIFQGFTLDFYVNDGQHPVIVGSAFGDTTFIDWIFSSNSADPFFVMQQLSYPGFSRAGNRPSKRSASSIGDTSAAPADDNVFAGRTADIVAEDSTATPGPPKGYISPKKFMGTRSQAGTERLPPRHLLMANELDIRSPEERDAMRQESYADKYIDAILMPEEREEERRLQSTSTAIVRVSFVDCVFDFNDPVINVLRFSGSDISSLYGGDTGGPESMEFVGDMDVRLVRNEFIDNIYSLSGDGASYRSLIDFYAGGRLTLRQNCFIRSPVKNFGVVTVNTKATVVNTRNYIDEVQPELKCPFVAYISELYRFDSCGSNAVAASCRANVATSAPSAAPGQVGNSGGGFGGGFCFPSDATVQVLLVLEDEQSTPVTTTVPMKNLKLGDKVLVGDDKYEAIYSFGHYAPDDNADYVKLTTTDGKSIELSRDHMLYVQGGHAVPASTIQIGDQVLALGGDTTIKTITVTTKQGAFAPFTASGVVIVNGIKAFTFVAFQDSEALTIGDNLFSTGLTFQFLAHTFEGPHRMWCQYVSSCTEETYTAEGISTWVALPHKIFVWFHAQNTVVMALMMIPISIMFVILANPVTVALLAIVLLLGRRMALGGSTTIRIKRA